LYITWSGRDSFFQWKKSVRKYKKTDGGESSDRGKAALHIARRGTGLSDKEIGRQFRNPNIMREAEKICERGKKFRRRIAKTKEICENRNIMIWVSAKILS
jgi:hypothetical protein